MRISLRGEAIASLVKDNSHVIDIGCDHALLDIYLVKNKKIKSIIASDINPKALAKGINNINKYNLQDKIITRLGDGLETKNKNTNTVIIAGLGGLTIKNILTKTPLDHIRHIILQPNNHLFKVRKALNKLGFIIDDEILVKDKNIIYTIISFTKGDYKYNYKQLYFGPILLTKRPHLMMELYNNRLKELHNIYHQLSLRHIIKKIKILMEINLIKHNIK